jgi:hypothetical protein
MATLVGMIRLSSMETTYGGIRIRTAPLIFGGSGTGKTALVRECARQVGQDGKPVPLLSLSCPSHIVMGSRTDPNTLTVIRNFVRKNPGDGGILHLDELDKALPVGSSAWTEHWAVSVLGELLSIMDCRPGDGRLLGAGWTAADIERISRMTIIGSGSWQRALDKAETDGVSHKEAIAEEPVLPPELARRFSPRHIELMPPSREDFKRALTGLYRDLGLPDPRPSMLDVLADAATGSELGFRFLESHVTDLLIKYPQLQRPRGKPDNRPVKDVVARAAYDVELRNAYALMEQAEIVVMLLRTQVTFHGAVLFPQQKLEDALVQEPKGLSLPRFQECCDALLAGLRLRYAKSVPEANELQKVFWDHAHIVAYFAFRTIQEKPTYLENHKLINLFTHVYLRVSRAISSWEYVVRLNPEDV